jgi:hypothetical protein
MKRHVFVNFTPLDIGALSGTVTSAIIKALSSQVPPEDAPAGTGVPVPLGVPGVVVVEASGVVVDGVSVGRDKPGCVGGRVEVTKIGAVATGVSSETVMQEPRLRLSMESHIQIFFIPGFYFGNITECRIICLITDLSFSRPFL